MSKFLHFNNLGIPIELIENISDISEIIIQSKKFFKVAQDYDFENNRFRYVLIDGILTELSVSEALTFQSLLSLKRKKENELNNALNISKVITIQNTYGGKTYSIVIDNNTPERPIFLEKLMTVLQESLVINVSISYQQKVNNAMYRFSALPTIWNYIFKDLFLIARKTSDGTPTGFKENSREHNKIIFDAVKLKIQNTTTKEELNAISWEFANPNGIFINVNEKAEQMLNDPTVDDFTKSAINQLKEPETGQIHLINIVG